MHKSDDNWGKSNSWHLIEEYNTSHSRSYSLLLLHKLYTVVFDDHLLLILTHKAHHVLFKWYNFSTSTIANSTQLLLAIWITLIYIYWCSFFPSVKQYHKKESLPCFTVNLVLHIILTHRENHPKLRLFYDMVLHTGEPCTQEITCGITMGKLFG